MNNLNALIAVLLVTREHRRIALVDDSVLCDSGRALNTDDVWLLREFHDVDQYVTARSTLDENLNRAGFAAAETLTNNVVCLYGTALLRQNSIVDLPELNVARERHEATQANEGH